MSVLNIPLLVVFYKTSSADTTIIERLTIGPLIKMLDSGSMGEQQGSQYLVLILFIFHIMFQHLQIVVYMQECEAWKN